MRIALISMPWRRPNNPAIGLALLKSAAQQEGVSCDVLYANDWWFDHLSSHPPLSEACASASFAEQSFLLSELASVIHAGEWMFSRHLFGDDVPDAATFRPMLVKAATSPRHKAELAAFVDAVDLVPSFLDSCLRRVDWTQYDAVGFSCVFYQLVPSLALARMLRDAAYCGEILFGGPLCEGIVGKKLLETFAFIDTVFDGEADHSFVDYLRTRLDGCGAPVPGTWQRAENGVPQQVAGRPVLDLVKLPEPDYSDFFEAANARGIGTSEIAFPVEGSRGCWWGQRHHCVFCGLNGSDISFRMKSAEAIFSEIVRLHERYGVNHFAFTDNIISPKFAKPLADKLIESDLGLTFHAEIKANLNRKQVQRLASAGFIYLQPGIESLSSHVLRVMNKGITALANLACLKFCAEAGITAFWNILHSFPGENAADYEQTLRLLPAIVHLRAPEVATAMRLTRFSPSFNQSDALGFHEKRPARFFKNIFPFPDDDLADLVNSFEFSFADHLDRGRYVPQIQDFLDRWLDEPCPGHLIFDPGDAGVPGRIYDSRFTKNRECLELDSVGEFVIRCCDTPCTMDNLLAQGHQQGVDPQAIRQVLARLEASSVVVREGDELLSLAVHDSQFIPWQAIGALEVECESGHSDHIADAAVPAH